MILGRGCQTYEQVWTPHIIKQAQLGVPHSKIHVELARLITELNKCLRSRRWKPLYIPIEGIWSDVQTRVGTPHMKINAFRLLFWGGDTAHNNCEDVHPMVASLYINNIFKCSDFIFFIYLI